MGKYLITGSPGAGKSTIVRALKRQGYKAYDIESMSGVTKLEDRATSKPVPWPKPPVDWEKYSFNIQEKGLKRLLNSDGDIFIAVALPNQYLFYNLFDTIFVLKATPDLIRLRLSKRRKKFGKLPEELALILHYHPVHQQEYLSQPQAIALEARQPIEQTIQEIITYAKQHQ